jgi:hypothetical protein
VAFFAYYVSAPYFGTFSAFNDYIEPDTLTARDSPDKALVYSVCNATFFVAKPKPFMTCR